MKKRVICVALCAALLMCMAGTAFAKANFVDFKMKFISTESFYVLCADTTSKKRLVSNNDYARLYVDENTSPKKNVYRISTAIDTYVSRDYFKDLTDGTWIYYTKDVEANKRVSLRGRPDSSVESCIVAGSFGAG